MWVVDLTDWLL